MLTIKYQTAFKKDYKRIVRRGYDVRLLGGTKTAAGDLPGSQPVRGLYWVQRVPYNPGLALDL